MILKILEIFYPKTFEFFPRYLLILVKSKQLVIIAQNNSSSSLGLFIIYLFKKYAPDNYIHPLDGMLFSNEFILFRSINKHFFIQD